MESVTFKDINLKLGVISCLNSLGYYKEEGAQLRAAIEKTKTFKESRYSYILPEVYEYYVNLEISQEHLDLIEEFYPGHYPYGNIMKEWNGEGDEFSITTLDGIEQLRNLKSYTSIMLDLDDADISALLKCEKLEFVDSSYTPDTEHVTEVLKRLEEKGIQIENY